GGNRHHARAPLHRGGGLHHRGGDRGRRRHPAVHGVAVMGELVDVKREGGIARVVMHRKGNNSIAEDLMNELAAAFDELGKDPSVRVAILASEYEKYFSVGADLTSLMGIDRQAPDATDQIALFMRRMHPHFMAIERCRKPAIAPSA